MPEQFTNYRVKGMKYRLTATKVDDLTVNGGEPCYIWFVPWTAGNGPLTTTLAYQGEMKQYPYAKYKMLGCYQGGRETVLQGYVDCAKLVGDLEAYKDSAYDGGVNQPLPGIFAWTDPTKLIKFNFGYTVVNGALTSGSNYMPFSLTVTYYVEFFNPSAVGVE